MGLLSGGIAERLAGRWLGSLADPDGVLSRGWLQKLIRGAVRGQLRRTLCLTFPAQTLSRLANAGIGKPAVRSLKEPFGLAVLPPSDALAVRTFNSVALFMASLFALGRTLRLPCLAVAPEASWIWFLPAIRALVLLDNVRVITVDLCRYGDCRRRPVCIMAVHCSLDVFRDQRCSGTGVCSTTGQPHWGWRRQARPPPGRLWPAPFADTVASVLVQATRAAQGRRLQRFFGC